jgi:uncharacterized membrane protein
MTLPPIHPLVVHTPIALLIVSFLFDLVGRATDVGWWRKAAFAMLVVGAIGAWAAVWTGDRSEDAAEDQGVPHDAIESHEAAGIFTMWMGFLAVAARALETRPGAARGAVSIVALVAHLLAATGVGFAGFRGGILVYEHGAGVKGVTIAAPGGEGHDERPAGSP